MKQRLTPPITHRNPNPDHMTTDHVTTTPEPFATPTDAEMIAATNATLNKQAADDAIDDQAEEHDEYIDSVILKYAETQTLAEIRASAKKDILKELNSYFLNKAIEEHKDKPDLLNILKARCGEGENSDVKAFCDGCITCDDLIAKEIPEPPQLLKGVLHRGAIGSLNGGSKAGKTKLLITLGLCVSAGLPWCGIETSMGKVLYWNFELPEFVMQERVRKIKEKLLPHTPNTQFVVRNMRGSKLTGGTFIDMLPALGKTLRKENYSLIIVDPIYQLYGNDMDENSAGDVHKLLDLLENLASDTRAAVIYAHHFAKGSQKGKNSIDRASGSGVFARFVDCGIDITDLTPDDHDSQIFSMDFTLRAFPYKKPIGIRMKGLFVTVDNKLDLSDIKKPGANTIKFTEKDITNYIFEKSYKTCDLKRTLLADLGMKEGMFYTLWNKVKTTDGVTENDQHEWSYIPPASNPPRIVNTVTATS